MRSRPARNFFERRVSACQVAVGGAVSFDETF
jgi:hypothetical protein